jgi:lysylphosphatidylglycerol synthetase-like protein (DUF2156 family)
MFKIWLKNKTTQLFFVLWLHISILNLFFVNKRGAVFLWKENSELNTFVTHFVVALVAVFFYTAVAKIRVHYSQKKVSLGNNLFVFGSVIMLAMIGLLLF